MWKISKNKPFRSVVAAYVGICTAFAILLVLATWGMFRDLKVVQSALLDVQMQHLRSQAERTARRIETDLKESGTKDLTAVAHYGWLRDYWLRTIASEEGPVYAALVDNSRRIVMHSDASREGKRLPHGWYNRIVFEVSTDVVETRSPVLASGQLIYDVRIPIEVDSQEVGEYHVGFDMDWFNAWSSKKQRALTRNGAFLIGGALLSALIAALCLFYTANDLISVRRAAELAYVQRATEVGKLAAGLAHEVRNPLHAIRLNLHSFGRAQEDRLRLSREEVTTMLEQSGREIDRVDQLMQELLGFATPDEPREEDIDLTAELRAVIDFIQQEMFRKNIELDSQLLNRSVMVRIDRGRLRQIMLNLLQNAQQVLEDGGRIAVTMARGRGRVQITVADDGPGISEADCMRIFEPFFSTKEAGTGLGLALVKRFVDEVDGEIHCQRNAWGGTSFCITLNEARQT